MALMRKYCSGLADSQAWWRTKRSGVKTREIGARRIERRKRTRVVMLRGRVGGGIIEVEEEDGEKRRKLTWLPGP